MSSITADRIKTGSESKSTLRTLLEWGGFAAGAVLIAFGVVAIVMGFQGRSTVTDSLKQEKIVGSADMTPAAIKDEAQKAGLNVESINLPTVAVAGQSIDTGDEARAFASYMRIHALEATGGYTYAEMGRFVAKPGTPKAQLTPDGATSNEQYALVDPATKRPVANGARDLWVTETALATALDMGFMSEMLSIFSIVVGVALLLTGIGLVILARAVFGRSAAVAGTEASEAPA
jgi:hypothetical protein